MTDYLIPVNERTTNIIRAIEENERNSAQGEGRMQLPMPRLRARGGKNVRDFRQFDENRF